MWRPVEVLPAVGALPVAGDEVGQGVQAAALALPRLPRDEAGEEGAHPLLQPMNPPPR